MVSVYGKLVQGWYAFFFFFAEILSAFFFLRTYSPVTLGSLQFNSSVQRGFANYIGHSECNPLHINTV